MTNLTRRDILKLTAVSLSGLLAASCGLFSAVPASSPTGKPASPSQTKSSPDDSPATPALSEAEGAAPDDRPRAAEVIVIGAGMAGLAAARQLADWDYDVILLEARNRIGGRTWTDDSLGLPLDLGASWIHGVNKNPMTALADKIGAPRVVTDYDSITRYKSDGTEFTNQESADIDALFEQFFEQVAEWQEETDNDSSLQDALDMFISNKRFSREGMLNLLYAVNTALEHEYGADISDLSLWEYDQDGELKGEDVLFPNGYGQLAGALAEGLDIRLGHIVRRVEYSADGARVTTDQGVFEGKVVLVTVPLGVLKNNAITFEPSLPKWKTDSIARLNMGVLNKCYLKFPEVFWDEESHLLGYVSEEKGQWCEWINFAALFNQPILLGFNAGEFGYEIESWTDEEIISSAMQTLRTIYGDAIPNPEGYIITRWGRDPFAFGSYSHIPPFASGEDYDALAKPVDNLFFAGEATHREFPSTVHGAYLSGVRAAEEIDKAL